jgi:hypothetical protein
MSFYTVFQLDGGEPDGHEVVYCRYSFNQAVDDKGRPASDVRQTRMNVNIVGTDKALLAWMLDPYSQKSGSVTFYRNDQESVLKKVSFTNAYCTIPRDRFDATGKTGETSLITQLVLSYEKLDIQGVTYDARWGA